FFSLVISMGSKSGFRTMSPRMSTARGTCSSRTFRWKDAYSFAVKASMWPPIESTSEAMSSAERLRVPLKTMCSMKWLMPDWGRLSWRLPRRSQTPMATLRTWSMASVTRVRPFGRTSRVTMGVLNGGPDLFGPRESEEDITRGDGVKAPAAARLGADERRGVRALRPDQPAPRPHHRGPDRQ